MNDKRDIEAQKSLEFWEKVGLITIRDVKGTNTTGIITGVNSQWLEILDTLGTRHWFNYDGIVAIEEKYLHMRDDLEEILEDGGS